MDFKIIVSGCVCPAETDETRGGAVLLPSVARTAGPQAVWEKREHNINTCGRATKEKE